MATKMLTISPSPHIHQPMAIPDIMRHVVFSMLPALFFSFYTFGWGAVYVTSLSIIFCLLVEYGIGKYLLGKEKSILDFSAVITGILLAFNVPANLPWYILLIGAIASIGIGKMAFGGLGKNPFNPALVGRIFLLISFPVQMTNWPLPTTQKMADGISGATPLGVIKEGIKNGETLSALADKIPSHLDLFLGFHGGSLGEISALALLLGLAWLLYKKIITLHIPLAMIAAIFGFSAILWGINPDRYPDPLFQILTGGVMLGAIFMATDYVTSPVTTKGMIVFGIGIGLLTVLIRSYGAYPEGVSFAILIMNAFTPLINRYLHPRRFGS
jgi:Na+-translocating ferredoxin:NAD+ oxidoreductase subunit D